MRPSISLQNIIALLCITALSYCLRPIPIPPHTLFLGPDNSSLNGVDLYPSFTGVERGFFDSRPYLEEVLHLRPAKEMTIQMDGEALLNSLALESIVISALGVKYVTLFIDGERIGRYELAPDEQNAVNFDDPASVVDDGRTVLFRVVATEPVETMKAEFRKFDGRRIALHMYYI